MNLRNNQHKFPKNKPIQFQNKMKKKKDNLQKVLNFQPLQHLQDGQELLILTLLTEIVDLLTINLKARKLNRKKIIVLKIRGYQKSLKKFKRL